MFNHKDYYQVCVSIQVLHLYKLVPWYTCTYLGLEVVQLPGEVLDLVLEVLLLRLVEFELRLQRLVLLIHSSNLIGAYMVLQVHALNPVKRLVYFS